MPFSFPVFSYIVALILDAFLIFFTIFHVVAFDELKTDYKNPIDQCNSLNPLVLPEYALHIFFNILFLFSGQWIALCLNLPLIAYHINRYRTRPVMSGFGLYDPTSIMNADTLSKCQMEGWIKLAFYLISFFVYLYGLAKEIKLGIFYCGFSHIILLSADIYTDNSSSTYLPISIGSIPFMYICTKFVASIFQLMLNRFSSNFDGYFQSSRGISLGREKKYAVADSISLCDKKDAAT